ncbi:inositol monophosphatase [halophilic archaeon]|nr:inositol monophosphatase [halophilic archaeon]
MRGRRLATIEQIVAIVSPDSEQAVERLEHWTTENGLKLSTIDVGESIDTKWDESMETLGMTIGGDGTFLEGIKEFAPRNIPLLGINTGTLAFLVRVDLTNLEQALEEVIQGRSTIDHRQQFHVDGPDLDVTGINDVMIQNPAPDNPVERKITKLDVYADDEYVGEYDGTGLAISTPTGSTGVSLSANGPIHNPKNNSSLQIVPLHTHKMGVRPLVVSNDTTIDVIVKETADLLVDGGRHHIQLEPDAMARITGADATADVVRTSYDDDFYTAISELLGWGARGEEAKQLPRNIDTTDNTADDELEHALEVATEAVRSVREPLRELHGRVESVTVKSDKSDIVTEADYLSENIITTAIENEFPAHNIRSEENVHIDSGSEFTWLLDPLDGTGNYANGNPNYCVSVGLLREDEPVVGVVYAPENDELWTAIKGETAYRDGQPITTTDRSDIAESMLMSGYDPNGDFLTHFYQDARGVRRLGSAALHLCYLASGSADAVWEYDTYPWDVAAGLVIAETAGAKVTNTEREPFELTGEGERSPLIGTNQYIHDDLLERLNHNDRLAK